MGVRGNHWQTRGARSAADLFHFCSRILFRAVKRAHGGTPLSLRPFMSAVTTNLTVVCLLGLSSSYPHGSGPTSMSNNIPQASHFLHATTLVPAPSSASASDPSLSSLDILTQAATGRPPSTEELSARPVLSVYASCIALLQKSLG